MTVLATVIFADISGSVALYESLGNERAAEAVAQLTDWIGTCIHGHAGRVVKKLGEHFDRRDLRHGFNLDMMEHLGILGVSISVHRKTPVD